MGNTFLTSSWISLFPTVGPDTVKVDVVVSDWHRLLEDLKEIQNGEKYTLTFIRGGKQTVVKLINGGMRTITLKEEER